LSSLLTGKQNTIWLDSEKTADGLGRLLEDTFRFHPLEIEDCLGALQRPKVEAYADHLFLTFPLVAKTREEEGAFQTIDLAFFWGPNYIVSVRSADIRTIIPLSFRSEKTSWR
ncbi:MAG: hypothetical protein HY509_01275, partial [Acidobacteria bacterium]|nr:hypothetical protein [Acidobacteriota bacterium]